MWVFGYGSLVWRAGFEYEERRVGFIRGYKRRFWQGSTDHRGVPGQPGRVVTLIASDPDSNNPEDVTWGVAYRVAPQNAHDVRQYLDHREKGGYSITFLDVYDAVDMPPIVDQCMVYVGLATNPNYLGEAPLNVIAEQIYHSIGPSGANVDYLLMLCNAMREMAPHAYDPHLFGLENYVLQLQEFDKSQNTSLNKPDVSGFVESDKTILVEAVFAPGK